MDKYSCSSSAHECNEIFLLDDWENPVLGHWRARKGSCFYGLCVGSWDGSSGTKSSGNLAEEREVSACR